MEAQEVQLMLQQVLEVAQVEQEDLAQLLYEEQAAGEDTEMVQLILDQEEEQAALI
jgi:hypothetical protein